MLVLSNISGTQASGSLSDTMKPPKLYAQAIEVLLKQHAFVVKRASGKKKGGQVSWRKQGSVDAAWLIAKAHAGWEL